MFNTGTGDTDPFRSTTWLGHLGNLKLSERTLLRVEPGADVRVPFLLREASYDVYNAPGWFASGAGFTSVPPEADGETWKFVRGARPGSPVTVAAYLNRGRGVLALPPGAFEIDRLAVVGVHRNRLGAVKVEEGLGLVTYTALFGPRGPLDGPPADTDLSMPPREAPLVRRVAGELAPEGKSSADTEADQGSLFEPLRDLWSWVVFLFSRWRWGSDDMVGRYAAWLLVPLVLLLIWRLYSRRRVGHGAAVPAPAGGSIARPGQDSEFYLIERRLESEGRGRRPWEPASAWIQRVHATEPGPIVELH